MICTKILSPVSYRQLTSVRFRTAIYRNFRRNPKHPSTSASDENDHDNQRFSADVDYRRRPSSGEALYTSQDLHTDYASANFMRNEQRQRRSRDDDDDDEMEMIENEENFDRNRTSKASIRRNKASLLFAEDDGRKTYTNENGLSWKVLNKKDYKFIKLMIEMKGPRAQREKLKKIILEGKRLIVEGLTSGLKLHLLFFVEPSILDELPLIRDEGELYQVSQDRMDAWSDMDHGPGVFAIMEKPETDFIVERQSKTKIPLTAIFDGIRDPRNFGAVMRTLAAVGCDKIIVLPGTCDAWQATVLRGGMGAHFFIPIHQYVGWEFVRSYLPDDFSVYLADNNSYEVIIEAESLKTPPCDDETNRQRISRTSFSFDDKRKRKVPVDNELIRPNGVYKTIQLPVVDLYRSNFVDNNHIALIIGGETKGLSSAAYQFAHKYRGVRCHVPMSNGVNSLNVSTAAGVIAYEMKRQFDSAKIKTTVDEEVDTKKINFDDKSNI